MPHNSKVLKRAVARKAFRPFQDGEPINLPTGLPITDYETLPLSDFALRLRVPSPYGPRYFEVRIKEEL